MRSACSACHARARLVRAQPLADLASLFLSRAQPLLPLPPASQSRLPCTLQSLRRRHRRQFCSPQPWQLRARASSKRRRRHLTPRAGQRHQPLTARPNLPFPTLPSSASKSSRRTSLLQRMQRQHHVRGRADWRTCMPSHAPHSPPAWIDQLTAPPAPLGCPQDPKENSFPAQQGTHKANLMLECFHRREASSGGGPSY